MSKIDACPFRAADHISCRLAALRLQLIDVTCFAFPSPDAPRYDAARDNKHQKRQRSHQRAMTKAEQQRTNVAGMLITVNKNIQNPKSGQVSARKKASTRSLGKPFSLYATVCMRFGDAALGNPL